jgi:hypothetical protein
MNRSSVAPPPDVALEIGQAVEEVQAVFLAFAEKEKRFTVLTVVPQRENALCRRVYAVEQQLIDRNQEFDFAFSVLASDGREPSSMVQDPGMSLAFCR